MHKHAYSHTHSRPSPSSPVQVVSITGSRRNHQRVRDISVSPEPVLGHIELSPNHFPSLDSHAPSATPPSQSSPSSFSPPPPPVTSTDTANTTTTSFIAVTNGNSIQQQSKEEEHPTTDNITGQRSSPGQLESTKITQEKTLFGVIVGSRNGAGSPSEKEGLTHSELAADQERRNRRSSNHTSTSSTPKNSPKIKKHKIKIGAHFRNSTLIKSTLCRYRVLQESLQQGMAEFEVTAI